MVGMHAFCHQSEAGKAVRCGAGPVLPTTPPGRGVSGREWERVQVWEGSSVRE